MTPAPPLAVATVLVGLGAAAVAWWAPAVMAGACVAAGCAGAVAWLWLFRAFNAREERP